MKKLSKTTYKQFPQIFLIWTSLLLIGFGTLSAQKMKTRAFQLSLLPPLSTSGLSSGQYNHAFTINLIAGYHGGVNGIELGGFLNTVRRDVRGAQFAGFANIVGGSTNGLQSAGFLNLSIEGLNGIQTAGFANLSIQAVKGTQIAGFCNLATGKVKGSQVAGFANLAANAVSGLQVAGFLNVTSRLEGLQIGVANVADTVASGAPIGVFSFVRRGGLKQLDFSYGDLGMAELSLRLGVGRFYNVFSAGYRPVGDDFFWAVGYGIGTNWDLTKRLAVNLEAMAYHLNEGAFWYNGLNELYRPQLGLEYTVFRGLSVYGGAAWNILLTDQRDENGAYTSDWIDGGLVEQSYDRVALWMRPGFQFGLRIGLR
ncbi:MAG: hypothetical protein AAF804_12945 [Bacteroidota bacterium]